MNIIENVKTGQNLPQKNYESLSVKLGKYEHFLNQNIEDLIQQS